jgi:DNA-binding NtrC family response regulator
MENMKRIVMIDDNKALVRITADILRGQGFEVVCMNTFEDADVFFRKSTEDVHTVLLDYAIGRKTGDVLAKTIRARHPCCKIVVVSGCTSKEFARINELLAANVIDGFVAKPFSLSSIKQFLR